MKAKKETHANVEMMDGVTGPPRMWADMLSQDYIWDFMETVEPMGIHMIDGKQDMKLNRMHDTLLGTSGGVSHHRLSPSSSLHGTGLLLT